VNIEGSRTLVAGATGELGSALTRALHAEGAELALAGRDAERLSDLGDEFDAPTARLDVRDPESSRTAIDAATAALGFGSAPELPEPLAVSEVVAAVIGALGDDRRLVAWDLKARELVTA
jgi:NAD(P)-dependent dehydrogenase (short-subunit alcohol dehydrogenase family)